MHPIPRFGSPWWTLLLSVGLTVTVGLISWLLTRREISGWYASLEKPRLNPPSWVFAPVWITLYILMGVSAWLVWQQPVSTARTYGLLWFLVQLALNFLWSLIFFRWHGIAEALAEIGFLWIAILATVIFFWKVCPLAGWLMLPYLLWVMFAAVLNLVIYRLNRFVWL